MNAIAVDEVPKVDTFGGLRRETETPEQALRRLERKNNFTKVIGTDEGQRLLAAATAQVKVQPNGGITRRPPASRIQADAQAAADAREGAAPAPSPPPTATRSSSAPPRGRARLHRREPRAGLRALPGRPAMPVAAPTSTEAILADVALDLVDIGANVRADPGDLQGLADSIVELGLQQPVTVTLTTAGRYTLLLGQRRVLASRLAKLPTIRAIVVRGSGRRPREAGARRSSEQLAENRVRLAMNPVDEAIALRAILDGEKKLTQVALAKRIGMSEPWVSSTLALLQAPARSRSSSGRQALDRPRESARRAAGRRPGPAGEERRRQRRLGPLARGEREVGATARARSRGRQGTHGLRSEARARGAREGRHVEGRPLFVNTDHWQIQDADVRKVIREAGYKVDDGWARSGERWSKCDCTALQLRIRDGEGSTISTVCVSDAHERAWQKERNAKATERQAAEEADRKRLASFIRAAMPPELNPTLGRLILKALDGYYGKTWTEYAKLTDEAVLKAIAAKLTSEEVLRGSSYNGDAKRIPLKTLIKELGGVEENSPTLAAKHPRRRPPEAIAAEAVADA
jgi:ParB/RepB/Spo0J family partition protein